MPALGPYKGPGELAGYLETLPFARGRRRAGLLGDLGEESAHAQSRGQADATSGEQRVGSKEADRDRAWPISRRREEGGRALPLGSASDVGWPEVGVSAAARSRRLAWGVPPRRWPCGHFELGSSSHPPAGPPSPGGDSLREASVWCLERTRTPPSRRDGCRRRLLRRPLRTAVCCLRPRPLPSVALLLPPGPVWDADCATGRGRGRVGLPGSRPIQPPSRAPR